MNPSSARPPVIVYTSCIGDGLTYLLERSKDFRQKYRMAAYISRDISRITDNTPILEQDYNNCAVFLHHPADSISFSDRKQRDAYDAVLENLPATTRKVEVPFPHFFALWPFHVADTRQNASGNTILFPYGDSYIIGLLNQGVPHDEAISRYLELDVSTVTDLDRQLELSRSYQRRNERTSDIKIADFVYENFREQKLFDTINHASNLLVLYIVNKILGLIGCEELPDSVLRGMPPLLVGDGIDMPIHPSISRHFGLKYADETTIYNYYGLSKTFEEYLRAYVYLDGGPQGAPPSALKAFHLADSTPVPWGRLDNADLIPLDAEPGCMLLREDDATALHRIEQTEIEVVAGEECTIEVVARPAGRSLLQIELRDDQPGEHTIARYDLDRRLVIGEPLMAPNPDAAARGLDNG